VGYRLRAALPPACLWRSPSSDLTVCHHSLSRSQPWSEAELEHFRHLLVTEGPNNWQGKASTLGTGRTAKSLHTRWLRDEGRIVDKPRGMAAMRDAAVQELAMRNTQG
jgi:hypothetical protein